jgi:hypothetical protein
VESTWIPLDISSAERTEAEFSQYSPISCLCIDRKSMSYDVPECQAQIGHPARAQRRTAPTVLSLLMYIHIWGMVSVRLAGRRSKSFDSRFGTVNVETRHEMENRPI